MRLTTRDTGALFLRRCASWLHLNHILCASESVEEEQIIMYGDALQFITMRCVYNGHSSIKIKMEARAILDIIKQTRPALFCEYFRAYRA